MKTIYNPTASVVPFFTADKFQNFIVGPVGCLHGGTLVVTEEGAIPIADIDRPMRVLSWNAKTCRFQLSWCGGSFPKGKENLFRVVTPQGEFDAAGSHLLLCADGEYRKVQDLQAGDVLAACSHDPVRYGLGAYPQVFPVDVPYSSQTDVDYLGDYATAARQCGQQFLQEEDTSPVSAPEQDDALGLSLRFVSHTLSRMGGLLVRLLQRIRCGLYVGLHGIGGSVRPSAHQRSGVVGCAESKSCERAVGQPPTARRSQWTCAAHRIVRGFSQLMPNWLLPSRSPSYGVSDRPILSLTRKHVKEAFWDIQVEETHNYVTIDGAVHHNSTKTTASIMKIAYEASKVAACRDGIRRSRCVVVRNTRQMLYDTTIPDFLKWFPDGQAGAFMKTDSKFILRFDDVECEVLFRGLDDANDVRRLLSLQITFGVMDEFREIHPDVFNALTGRLGRYPDKTMNGVGACDDNGKQVHKVWGATNPPDADTFWEELLTNPPENASVTFQPSGRSPEADWVNFLPDLYYENLCHGKTEDWISVYVDGEFGRSLSGQPVFRCFSRDTHVAKSKTHVLDSTVLIGADAGLNPTATIGQVTYDGRLVIHDTITGNEGGMGALRFVREKLKPLLSNKYKGLATLVIIDPAAFQRAQTDERSVADIFKAEGFAVKAAKTNSIVARLAACESYMTRTVGDKPALLVSPDAELLIKAWGGKYRYKVNTKGERDDKPEKSHPWSDVADSAQYLCLHADGGGIFGGTANSQRREIKPAPYKWV